MRRDDGLSWGLWASSSPSSSGFHFFLTEIIFLFLQPDIVHTAPENRTVTRVFQEGFTCRKINLSLAFLLSTEKEGEERARMMEHISFFFLLFFLLAFLLLLFLFFCCLSIYFLFSCSCLILFSTSFLCFLSPLFAQEEIFSLGWRKGRRRFLE